jgi:hypothetical protein
MRYELTDAEHEENNAERCSEAARGSRNAIPSHRPTLQPTAQH